MKHMIFIYTADTPDADLREQIALLPSVEMVYDFGTRGILTGWERPDFVVIVRHNNVDNNVGFFEAVEALSPGVRIHSDVIWHEQPHIIGVDDIPGPVPTPRMRVAQPIIERVPGIEPSNTAVVHSDFSSQAGLASFATVDAFTGFGSGLPDMATLAD